VENIRKLLGRFENNPPHTMQNLEDCLLNFPEFPINSMLNGHSPKKREEEMQKWASSFLPMYKASPEEERLNAISAVVKRTPIQLYNLIEAIGLHAEKSDDMESFLDFATKVASKIDELEDIQPDNSQEITRYLKTSNNLTSQVKDIFNKPDNSKLKSFQKIAKNTTASIILEAQVSDNSHSENLKLLLINLTKAKRGEIQLPADGEFTRKLLEIYGSSKKVKKVLKIIHQRFPRWSETQTVKPRKNKK
jgi:hypothetical protein